MITIGDPASTLQQFGKPFELLSADGGLDVGHAVVVAEFVVTLEDHFAGAVTNGVGYRHAMLTPETELRVERGIAGGQHAPVPRRDELARMEGKAGDVAVRPSDFLPISFMQDLAADGAGGIFDDSQIMTARNFGEGSEVAGHSHLVHAKDRAGSRRDGAFYELRI